MTVRGERENPSVVPAAETVEGLNDARTKLGTFSTPDG
jgi:hypothetical protein